MYNYLLCAAKIHRASLATRNYCIAKEVKLLQIIGTVMKKHKISLHWFRSLCGGWPRQIGLHRHSRALSQGPGASRESQGEGSGHGSEPKGNGGCGASSTHLTGGGTNTTAD